MIEQTLHWFMEEAKWVGAECEDLRMLDGVTPKVAPH